YKIRTYSYYSIFSVSTTTELSTLSLHDALPILCGVPCAGCFPQGGQLSMRQSGINKAFRSTLFRIILNTGATAFGYSITKPHSRSEEHTSELQSREKLVCRLLLEKIKILINLEI